MTSSTWTSESPLRLIGCGVDAERPARFEKLRDAERPWHLVYSEREVAHVRGLRDQALGYCAAFCCKEAVVKALGESFPFPECEAFFEPEQGVTLRLSPRLARKSGVRASEVRLSRPAAEEIVAVVYLFGGAAT
jgi:phosphopantetheinyl transferase (holo-ACP synthase)